MELIVDFRQGGRNQTERFNPNHHTCLIHNAESMDEYAESMGC